jgi:hypothetical protein
MMPSETTPVVLADTGVENVNAQVDDLIASGALRRVLAFTELKFSNSMIEAWWRSLTHQWLFLHSLDVIDNHTKPALRSSDRRQASGFPNPERRLINPAATRRLRPQRKVTPQRQSAGGPDHIEIETRHHMIQEGCPARISREQDVAGLHA